MTTITAKLTKGHWVATEDDVETLAHERYANAVTVASIDGTYLRVILVAVQAQLGRPRRGPKPDMEAQLSVLSAVHSTFYAAVLRGVTTEDVAHDSSLDSTEQRRRSLERNSRSAFARTSMSTLAAFVKGGGDLRTLDPATTTKTGLRAAIAPPEPADRVERQIQRATGSLLRAIGRKAKTDPQAAQEDIEAIMDELQKVLDSLANGEEEEEPAASPRPPPERVVQRTRVGIPQLHRGT